MGLLLYSLQIAGEDSLSKISEYGVISFFYKDGEYLRGYTAFFNTPAHFVLLSRDRFWQYEIG